MNKHITLTPDQKAYVVDNIGTYTQKSIAQQLNISHHKLNQNIKLMGLNGTGVKNISTHNFSNFFNWESAFKADPLMFG